MHKKKETEKIIKTKQADIVQRAKIQNKMRSIAT